MLPTPPIGQGGYAGWFFLVIVIMLSVALGSILLGAVGLKAKG